MELNKVMVVGRLCADPNFRTTGSGTSVCDIRLAVDSGYGERKETVYLDVTVWSKTADFARQYLSKGQKVYAGGRLKQDEWNDKETGAKRTKIGMVADRIQFAEPKRESAPQTQYSTDDDLPI